MIFKPTSILVQEEIFFVKIHGFPSNPLNGPFPTDLDIKPNVPLQKSYFYIYVLQSQLIDFIRIDINNDLKFLEGKWFMHLQVCSYNFFFSIFFFTYRFSIFTIFQMESKIEKNNWRSAPKWNMGAQIIFLPRYFLGICQITEVC